MAEEAQPPGQNLLVTGAASGIGRAIAMAAAAAGWRVVAADISPSVHDVVQAIDRAGGDAIACVFDASDPDEAGAEIARAREALGRITAVVAAAAIVDHIAPAHRMTPAGWAREVDVNLNGVFYSVRPALDDLRSSSGGRVVVLSSIAALGGLKGQVAYSATKAALFGFVKTLAVELAPAGVSVNALALGMVATEKVEAMPDHIRLRASEAIPLRRFASLEEVTRVTLFLLSPAAGYITGTTIVMDGGLTLNALTLGPSG